MSCSRKAIRTGWRYSAGRPFNVRLYTADYRQKLFRRIMDYLTRAAAMTSAYTRDHPNCYVISVVLIAWPLHCVVTCVAFTPYAYAYNFKKHWSSAAVAILPRCMEAVCLTVCLSVGISARLSNAWIVTKRKKDMSRFLHHMKII